MIKTIIVDDEPLALDILESHISKIPELELVARCNNALEANQVMKEHDIALIFLDIQMPEISGIEFAKSLTQSPMIIFTTAHPDYAFEGFELDAVDYLLKPISLDRFIKATNKVLDKTSQSDRKNEDGDDNDFFFVKADKKLVKVKYSDILYIEGLKDYVIIRMEEGRVITLQTMKSLEAKLPQNLFKRVHRSYIVGIDKIKAIEGNMVELIEKGKAKHIPIGKNYREELLNIINSKRL